MSLSTQKDKFYKIYKIYDGQESCLSYLSLNFIKFKMKYLLNWNTALENNLHISNIIYTYSI